LRNAESIQWGLQTLYVAILDTESKCCKYDIVGIDNKQATQSLSDVEKPITNQGLKTQSLGLGLDLRLGCLYLKA